MLINLSEINTVTYLIHMDVWWPPSDKETGTQSSKYTDNWEEREDKGDPRAATEKQYR